jgi:hypothetical protein
VTVHPKPKMKIPPGIKLKVCGLTGTGKQKYFDW